MSDALQQGANGDPVSVNVTVDNVTQGDMLLQRFNIDRNTLTAVTVVSNRREIPGNTGTVRYEILPLDAFMGENLKDWDGHSPITLYFLRDGQFDHYEKTGIATAGASAA